MTPPHTHCLVLLGKEERKGKKDEREGKRKGREEERDGKRRSAFNKLID